MVAKCGILRSRTQVSGSWPSVGDYLITPVYLCWDLKNVTWNMKEKRKKGRGTEKLSRAFTLLKNKFSSLIFWQISLYAPGYRSFCGFFFLFNFFGGHLCTTNQSLPVIWFWNKEARDGNISQEDHWECTVICKNSDSNFIPFVHVSEIFLLQLLRFKKKFFFGRRNCWLTGILLSGVSSISFSYHECPAFIFKASLFG